MDVANLAPNKPVNPESNKSTGHDPPMFSPLFGMISNDIAIDLGTANTLDLHEGQRHNVPFNERVGRRAA